MLRWLRTAVRSGGHYDLMLALTDWLPDLMQRGGLRPIDDFLAADPPEGWPSWLERLGVGLAAQQLQASVFGMPYHDGPEILHYRTDLFDSATEQARFAQQYGITRYAPLKHGRNSST